jgi:hypothetical protein
LPNELFTGKFKARNKIITPFYRAHEFERRTGFALSRDQQLSKAKMARENAQKELLTKNQNDCKRWDYFRDARNLINKKAKKFNDSRNRVIQWVTMCTAINASKLWLSSKLRKRD